MSDDEPREPAPLVLRTTVSQRRLRIARFFTYASLSAVLVPPLLSAVAGTLTGVSLVFLAVRAFLTNVQFLGLLASPFLAMTSALTSTPTVAGWRGASEVSVDENGLVFRRDGIEHRIERAQISDAFVIPAPTTGVELVLASGDTLMLDLASEEEAQSVLARLGFAPNERRVTVRLASPQRQLAAGCVGLPLIFAALVIVTVLLSTLGLPLIVRPFVSTLGTLVFTLLLFRARRPPEVVIGTDGFQVVNPFGKTYHPFSTFLGMSSDDGELRLRSGPPAGEGEVVARGEPSLVKAAAKRIEAARAAHSNRETAKTVAELLDVGHRSPAEWRASLSALTGESGYRRIAITPEALRSVLEDPEEARTRRVGAAMLLRIASPEAAPRIRIAADACADDDLRAALEAAAEDEVTDAVLGRLIAKRS